jgi:hypothetical protein
VAQQRREHRIAGRIIVDENGFHGGFLGVKVKKDSFSANRLLKNLPLRLRFLKETFRTGKCTVGEVWPANELEREIFVPSISFFFTITCFRHMKTMISRVSILCLLMGFLSPAFAVNYTFNVASGDWNTAANWSPSGVPGAGDNVTILSRTVNLTSNVSVNNLTISGSSETLHGIFGNFDISVAGILDCSQGDATFQGSGTITVAGLTQFPIDYCFPWPCVTTLDGKTLVMNGGGSLGATGTISFKNNGLLTNSSGSTFTITASAASNYTRMGTGVSTFTNGTFENYGTIVHTGVPTERTIIYVPFNNYGTVNVINGSEMIINGGGIEQNAMVNISASSVFSFSQTGTNTVTNSTFTGVGWLASNHPSMVMPAGNTVNCRLKIAGTPSGSTFTDQLGISPIELYISGQYTRSVGTTMNTGNATLFGGICSGNFDANISGSLNYQAGELSGTGTFSVTGPTTVSSLCILSAKTLIMNGGCSFSGQITFSSSSVLRNPVGAVFSGVGTLKNADSSTGTFENFGTIQKTQSGDLNIWCAFTNTGTVNFTTGRISMAGGGTHNGATVTIVNAGLEYAFSGAAAHNITNSSFDGQGWFFNSNAVSLNLNTGTSVTCRYKQTGGTSSTTTDNVGISPIEFSQTGGSCVYNRTVTNTMSTGNATMGGVCMGDFDANISGTLAYSTGTISGTGTFTVTGKTTVTSTCILDKKTLIMNGDCAQNGVVDLNNNAILRNAGGSTLTPANGISILSGGTFENLGIIDQNTTGSFGIGSNFNNSGTLKIQKGLVTTSAPLFQNSGIVKGIGTFQVSGATVNNNTGTYAPGLSPGNLTYTGNYTNATLDFEIAESGGVVNKDLLSVTGNMTLNNTLNINYLGGTVPPGIYDIAVCTGTRSGTFSTVNYPANCNGGCSISYTATKAQLVIATALALDLVSISAVSTGPNIQVRWRTAHEVNVRDFEIERSTDGIRWSDIGTVAANNQTRETTYEFTDQGVKATLKDAEQVYYRLKINDLDGSFTYSPVRNIQMENKNHLGVFPNPATNTLSVSFEAASETTMNLQLFDYTGRLFKTQSVETGKGSNVFTMDIADLPAGLYWLQAGNQGISISKN